jgi:peptidoglycan lytic transglycosylase G
MRNHLNTAWGEREPDLPLKNPYQALILASIVEKETGRESDRGMVAAVFVNRLRFNMPLQTDPTVIYGLADKFDGNLRKKDLLTDHEYNTYTRRGLPPTPIALPGLPSIKAVLNPAKTNALYFVAKGNGESHFSTNLSDHNRAVLKYQKTPKSAK